LATLAGVRPKITRLVGNSEHYKSCSFQSPHKGMCSRIGLGNKYD
jgi:hypothetical protein